MLITINEKEYKIRGLKATPENIKRSHEITKSVKDGAETWPEEMLELIKDMLRRGNPEDLAEEAIDNLDYGLGEDTDFFKATIAVVKYINV